MHVWVRMATVNLKPKAQVFELGAWSSGLWAQAKAHSSSKLIEARLFILPTKTLRNKINEQLCGKNFNWNIPNYSKTFFYPTDSLFSKGRWISLASIQIWKAWWLQCFGCLAALMSMQTAWITSTIREVLSASYIHEFGFGIVESS